MVSKPTYEELTAKIGDLEKQVEELRGFKRLWEKTAARLKETESALEECRTRYQDLFENAPIGIFQTTSEGRANYVNPYMARLVGGEQASSTSPLFTDLSNQLYADPQRRSEFLRILEETGEVQGFEYEAMRTNGSRRWFSMNARISQRFNDGTFAIDGFIADITEEKKAEQKRLDLEKQLQQSQKLESVGRLAGGVAHDFNNLLSIVLGYSELIMENIHEAQPHREPLQQIHDAGVRARNLTRQLLAFSRKQVLEIQTVDANKVISGFDKLLQRIIGEDIRLHLKLSPEPIYFKADPPQIEQVLMNLAINARDAMPDGGTLAIETAAVNLDADYAEDKPGVSPGPHVMIAISDNGIGMDAHTRQHIFEPFFSTKDKEKGTGLGLATCYGIVRQHGGNIWVYSEPGQGTTFKIYLPYSPGLEPAAEDTDAGAAAPINGSATILVAEDDPVVRQLACDVLQKNGFHVISAADGNQLIDLARQQQGPIHLILTDVIMPGMKGPEVYQRVAGYHPDVKVLYMSGYTDNIVAHHGILDADVAFIQKPFSIKHLVAKVNQVLGQ